MYEEFASVYDELMDDVPYGEWAELIHKLILLYGISKPYSSDKQADTPLEEEKNLVLDLACGTGTVTELLSQKGYDMIGIDASDAMLSVANEKKEQSGSGILYLNQEMQSFELYGMVGTIYCICDSINYLLTDGELRETLRLIQNYLYSGGIFIFDFNTVYKYREIIGDSTIAEDRENVSFIWENYYEEESRINEYDLTLFTKADSDSGLYIKTKETHLQRGFEETEIQAFLKEAGLNVVTTFDADTREAPTKESERIFVVARK